MSDSSDPPVTSYKPGFSLPQHFYVDEAQYQRDARWLRENLWFLVDHESRIPKPGDFFLYEYHGESIIIVRDREGQVRAHYNVCRHRGSRICTQPQGNVQLLVCPYHAWAYGLDGTLRAASFMPADFAKEHYELFACHVRVHCGLIFISLATSPPDFSAFVAGITGELEFHEIAHAKILHRTLLSTAANWKLVVQNNLECYHCRPAHPTYWAAHPGTLGDPPLPNAALEPDPHSEAARKFDAFEQDPTAPYQRGGRRRLIGGKFLTESVGGAPVAPLMGRGAYDGFQSQFMVSPLTTLIINPDYTVFYNFVPRSVRQTDIDVIWLVKDTALPGVDVDTGRVIAVWDATLREDKTLLDNNQLGVESALYEPGPYSTWESGLQEFDRRYLKNVVAGQQ
jgi:phenylpropionate dioxygenase-like ring-hydroxylating dioxygenase large terminal subunit